MSQFHGWHTSARAPLNRFSILSEFEHQQLHLVKEIWHDGFKRIVSVNIACVFHGLSSMNVAPLVPLGICSPTHVKEMEQFSMFKKMLVRWNTRTLKNSYTKCSYAGRKGSYVEKKMLVCQVKTVKPVFWAETSPIFSSSGMEIKSRQTKRKISITIKSRVEDWDREVVETSQFIACIVK